MAFSLGLVADVGSIASNVIMKITQTNLFDIRYQSHAGEVAGLNVVDLWKKNYPIGENNGK